MTPSWERKFHALAEHISTWSKDPSTRVGCVIVGHDMEILSTGYNGFPRGIADDERLHDRPTKHRIIVHAEENAIMQAARVGVSLRGSTLVVTHPPCDRCARSMLQAGVSAVRVGPRTLREDWDDGISLLREGGVDVHL